MSALAAENHRINQDEFARAIEQLREFVAIPSASNPDCADYNPLHLQAAADYATGLLRGLDLEVRQVSIDGSAPFVLAEKVVDAAKPTLLFYAHYDVQPVDREKWATDPFVLTERDGRLYGRGSSDDKGGIIGIVTALANCQKTYGALPVNVKVLFEGEEEYGSSHMGALIQSEGDRLKADALVILDGSNLTCETGTLTNFTRGILNLHLRVETMAQPIHSGVGCLAPDPSLILAELMLSLKDPRAIPGFMDDCKPLTERERVLLKANSQTAGSYARDHALFPEAQLRGHPDLSISERVREEPSISFVNGHWGKPNGGNSIQSSASCQIGVRLTAGQDPARIAQILTAYLTTNPHAQNCQIHVEQRETGASAWEGDLSRPYARMYLEALGENFERSSVQPIGGALPLLHQFKEAFPVMESLIPGVEFPGCNAHSHNESQDIRVLESAINSLISFIRKVGRV